MLMAAELAGLEEVPLRGLAAMTGYWKRRRELVPYSVEAEMAISYKIKRLS